MTATLLACGERLGLTGKSESRFICPTTLKGQSALPADAVALSRLRGAVCHNGLGD